MKGSRLIGIKGVPKMKLPFSAEWQERCKERLKELGVEQKELAIHVGKPEGQFAQSGVSQALGTRPGQQKSEWVLRISVALGQEIPNPARVAIIADALADDEAKLQEVIDALKERVPNEMKRYLK